MKTTIQEQDGNMVAYLEGSLDTSTAPETEKAMRPLYECEGKDIIFDCTGLTYISSAGLRVLLIMNKALDSGRRLQLIHLNENIRSILKTTGFEGDFG